MNLIFQHNFKARYSRATVLIMALSLLQVLQVDLGFSTTTCTVSSSTIPGSRIDSTTVAEARIDSITSTAACNYVIPTGFNNVSIVAVGGGGSGGTDAGSGGGGGGVQIRSNISLSSGTTLSIDIGEGGAARATSNEFGNNGTQTTISGGGVSITAEGGQGGQPCTFDPSSATENYCHTNTGGDPGLGGGRGGTGPFHGFPNRTGVSTTSATLAFTQADDGTPFQIGNTRLFFGGGGGGSVQGYGPGGNPLTLNGGRGGGGHGETATAASSGAPNTGGGGGGGSASSGSGGSGIVLVVLQNLGGATDVSTSCSQGSFSKVQSGLEVIITYLAATNQNGTCTLTVPTDVYTAHYLVVAGGGGGSSGGGGAGGAISSWRAISEGGTQIANRSSPLVLSPGATIDITVGSGGAAGIGGSIGCWGTCTSGVVHRVAGGGNNSSLGSITARGGGRGGQGISGGSGTLAETQTATGGGSGGGAGFDVSTSTAAATSSTVVGATTYGSSGGTVSSSGGYRAGSGGGGGAESGGGPRRLYFRGDSFATPNSNSGVRDTLGGGGNGGRGIYSNIGNFAGIYTAYSCGGGGGVNSNLGRVDNGAPFSSITTVWGAGGKAGCYSGGKGSNRSTRRSNTAENSTTPSNDFNGTSGVDGFGGGGGGTDPEDMNAGRGGNGVVVVRFRLPDPNCPNDRSVETVTAPIACIARLKITAGDTAASTEASRTSDVANAPISYSDSSTTVTIVTGVDGLNTSVVNNKIVASVTSSTSSLIGGTYPVTYELTSETRTSESYLLVTVRDPAQKTQTRVPVDPRDKTVTLPRIVLGRVQAVQVCVSPRSSISYPDTPTVTLQSNPGATSQSSPTGFNLRLQGTAESITANIGLINLTSAQSRLIQKGIPITLDVNVSNTSTGGNGACDFGTDSVMTVFPLRLTQIRSFTILPKNGRENN